MADVNGMYDFGQVMTDMVFSYGELGFQEFETQRYLGGILKENGFTVENGVAGIPTAWVAKWGSGRPVIALGSDVDCIPQASQKPGVAYPRPDRRRRARARRGPQLRHAAQHRRGHRRQAHHGAREAAGHDHDLAGRRRRAARHQGLLRARGPVQGRRPGDVQPRRLEPGDELGRQRRQRPHLGRVPVRGRDRAQRRRAVARPQRARRRRADERRLELPARAPAPAAAVALRGHQRRRPAQRRAAQRRRLVLLPRDQLRRDQEPVGHRRQDGRGRRADDQHHVDLARARARRGRRT